MKKPSQIGHLTEEDVRTQVVYPSLLACGFSAANIHIERSVSICLGHGKKLTGREDVLVKSTDGRNLLVIEVKRPEHALSAADARQAISYACAQDTGGIAPFTILTNGLDSRIFDSVTRQELSGSMIPTDHPYVQNNFCATGDQLTARTEALEYLITVDAGNLLAFCKGQVAFRMKRLKSEELFGYHKYIPKLYVDRPQCREKLEQKLFRDHDPESLLLVVGPPQHGKTCFLCHTAEDLLTREIPCLFYTAIGLENGLLNALQEDFEWASAEHLSSVQVVDRLNRIMVNLAKELVIVVDGWNEMPESAVLLNEEIQRLENKKIKILISTTSPSLARLLRDRSGNPGYVENQTKLNPTLIKHLSGGPLPDDSSLNILQIGKFTATENQAGYKVYENAYKVSFPQGTKLFEVPFYLRLAAEQYAGKNVPKQLTRTDLITESLIRKADRQGIDHQSLFRGLASLAAVIDQKNAPFSCLDLPAEFRDANVFRQWQDASLLTQLHESSVPVVDFYYTHDRDYAFAILHRKWPEVFKSADLTVIQKHCAGALSTEAGRGALHWFLSNPEYEAILINLYEQLVTDLIEGDELQRLLLGAVSAQDMNDMAWFRRTLYSSSENQLYTYLSNKVSHQPLSCRDFCLELKLLINVDTALQMDLSSLDDNPINSRSQQLIDIYLKKESDYTISEAYTHSIPFLQQGLEPPILHPQLKEIYQFLASMVVAAEPGLACRAANLLVHLSYRDFFILMGAKCADGSLTNQHLTFVIDAMTYCVEQLGQEYYGQCMSPGLIDAAYSYPKIEGVESDEDDELEEYDYDNPILNLDRPEIVAEVKLMKQGYLALIGYFTGKKLLHLELVTLWNQLNELVTAC